MKLQVCLAQIGLLLNTAGHIRRIKEIIGDYRKADLIVFPELILHGHPSAEKPEGLLYRKVKKYYSSTAAESDDLYSFIKNADARVIIGELKEEEGAFYNVATYIDTNHVDHYAKTHVHWTENFLPGKELKVFNTPKGKVGITICFDSAFVEIWRVLALNGAEVVVNISATPETFPAEYIRRRLRGAAISNQIFVVYVNRPDKHFSGQSAIINPQGETVIELGEGERIITAEIDLAEVEAWRLEEQIYGNRRPLLYRDIVNRHIT